MTFTFNIHHAIFWSIGPLASPNQHAAGSYLIFEKITENDYRYGFTILLRFNRLPELRFKKGRQFVYKTIGIYDCVNRAVNIIRLKG